MDKSESIVAGLRHAGLSPSESAVYVALLRCHSSAAASSVAADLRAPRSTVHLALENLVRRGFAGKIRKSGHTAYFLEDPEKVLRIFAAEKEKMEKTFAGLRETLSFVASNRSPTARPKLRMYEGRDGVVSVLADSLRAQEPVLTLVSADEMDLHFREENRTYLSQRAALGTRKKALVGDTPFARKAIATYDRSVTESRIFPDKEAILRGETNIYDGKVSFVTYRDRGAVGFVVEDRDFYDTFQSVFKHIWKRTEG